MPECCAALQKDFDRLERWAERNHLKFNKGKCRVLHLGKNNPLYQHRLEADLLESSCEEGPGDSVDNKLSLSQQCALGARKAIGVLRCIMKSIGSRTRVLMDLGNQLQLGIRSEVIFVQPKICQAEIYWLSSGRGDLDMSIIIDYMLISPDLLAEQLPSGTSTLLSTAMMVPEPHLPSWDSESPTPPLGAVRRKGERKKCDMGEELEDPFRDEGFLVIELLRILYIWKRHHNLLKCNNARGAVPELILNILKAFRKIFSVLLVIVTNVRKMSRTMTWTRPEIKIIEKDVKNYWGDLEEVMRQAAKLHG
ncbi:hypothetical protein HGM15179_000421 [Zosterops borbonicus]|uniref:Rna-directed dna polymerase from mobile element jockey-like n=1 Tax=Zosterops borbonicus TaxID=364589 RepID=A0A8K1H0K0_9PASS|nr:hypothetical protein HGM15179_000421 [Zosterops borbonicus]